MKKIFTFCILFITLSTIAQQAFIKDSLDIFVDREMKKWKIPAVAVAIVKDGKIILTKGYGVLEIGKNEKVNEHTLFQIASNSKAFTGTAIALLEYQKKISLDDKVQKYMPWFQLKDATANKEIQVKDLLCHRIGFETFQSDFLNWNSNVSRKFIIENMRNVTPVYGFREKYGYCNAAFLAAGELIPIVSDTSWDDYLKHRFFVPLKMNRTTTQWKYINTDVNAAKPYTLVNDQLVKMPYANIDNLGPAASINSSVHDLANWVLMQLDSGKFEGKSVIPWKVINQTRNPLMYSRKVNNKIFPTTHFEMYGLGWVINDYDGGTLVSHTGGSNGFVTSVTIMPEKNIGIIVFTNTDQNSLFLALKYQLLDACLNKPYFNYSNWFYDRFRKGYEEELNFLKKEKELVAKKNKSSLPLQAYTGTYNNEVYGDITISIANNQLVIDFPKHNQTKGILETREGNTFLCTYSDVEWGVKVIPFTVEGTNVKSVTITVNDFIDFLPYEFKKIK